MGLSFRLCIISTWICLPGWPFTPDRKFVYFCSKMSFCKKTSYSCRISLYFFHRRTFKRWQVFLLIQTVWYLSGSTDSWQFLTCWTVFSCSCVKHEPPDKSVYISSIISGAVMLRVRYLSPPPICHFASLSPRWLSHEVTLKIAPWSRGPAAPKGHVLVLKGTAWIGHALLPACYWAYK